MAEAAEGGLLDLEKELTCSVRILQETATIFQ